MTLCCIRKIGEKANIIIRMNPVVATDTIKSETVVWMLLLRYAGYQITW